MDDALGCRNVISAGHVYNLYLANFTSTSYIATDYEKKPCSSAET
jgi:hypothetical protein